MAKTIMDVSKHQGVIDWAKVKASGQIDGVMLRAMGNSAEGKPSKPYTDPQFARNYAECKRLGIPCGVYGYFKATNKAQADKELAYCLSTVESWGVYALLYTGLWFGQTYLYMGGAALKAYDVWLAAYRSVKPTPGWPFGMWQYTSTAHVPGVVDATPGKTTNVDLSRAYKDYAGIIQRAGLGAVRG